MPTPSPSISAPKLTQFWPYFYEITFQPCFHTFSASESAIATPQSFSILFCESQGIIKLSI